MTDEPATTPYQVIASATPLRKFPSSDGARETQLLAGEVFHVHDHVDGWAQGAAALDGYEGWVKLGDLAEPALIPTHTVKTLRTYIYTQPDMKSEPVALVSLNAKIVGARRQGRFIEAQRMGWVLEDHLRAVGEPVEPDWVAVAERFEGAPYLWGGKESLGLDCSGLIQTAMEAAGRFIPRDSGAQEAWAQQHAATVALTEGFTGLKRGDLVFWPGHVGVMTDAETLLHANGHHMMAVTENLARAAKRIAFNYAPVNGIYRLT